MSVRSARARKRVSTTEGREGALAGLGARRDGRELAYAWTAAPRLARRLSGSAIFATGTQKVVARSGDVDVASTEAPTGDRRCGP